MIITIFKTDPLGNTEQMPFIAVADEAEAYDICSYIAEKSNNQLDVTFKVFEGV